MHLIEVIHSKDTIKIQKERNKLIIGSKQRHDGNKETDC